MGGSSRMKQNEQIKLSVIVCAYNSEKFIRKCLDSLVNQTFKSLEIILVNDGSEDNTEKIMKEYQTQYQNRNIKVISQENKGTGYARNKGIDSAEGEYITFVDSDDWVEAYAYERIYKKISKKKYDVVVFNWRRVIHDVAQKKLRNIKEEEIDLDIYGRARYILKYLLSYTHEYSVCNKIFRRDFLKQNNLKFPDSKNMLYEDNLFSFEWVCCARTVYAFDEPLYYYTTREGSVTDMKKAYRKMVHGFSETVETFRNYAFAKGMKEELQPILPLVYYSLVFFCLIRVKHFGHININGCVSDMRKYPHFEEYMKAMNKLSVRAKLIKYTLPGVRDIKNWQVNGLLLLTQVQAKLICSNILKGNDTLAEKCM